MKLHKTNKNIKLKEQERKKVKTLCQSNESFMIVHSKAGLIRIIQLYERSYKPYFCKSYERSGENVKVGLDLSIYAMKADLEGAVKID